MSERSTLTFVSTRFLFPVDSGGKIRTTQVLHGMLGGRFRIRLLSPATEKEQREHAADLAGVCDEFRSWPAAERGTLFSYLRLRHLPGRLPVPVRTDWDARAARMVRESIADDTSVVVFDFLHAAVLAPAKIGCPSVLFTHNVEAEIFARHATVAENPVKRMVWTDQHRKMRAFEGESLRRFDLVVAVSERDREQFVREYGLADAFVIPTGVDLDYFAYAPPGRRRDVVFMGSMDWIANQEAVGWFMDDVWPSIASRVPDARMTVVGRAPPDSLVQRAARRNLAFSFTGFVDDVRPHVQGSAVSVIPLRVGGGTRLKVYESMAMGSPIVSTTTGVEGLPVARGEHYLCADDAQGFADAVVALLENDSAREEIAIRARRHVEDHCSFRVAAGAFEAACERAMQRHRSDAAA